MTPVELAGRIKAAARARGFAEVGVASAAPTADGARLREWLAAGMHGGMGWMANADVRENPARLLPGARSVVVCAWPARAPEEPAATGHGRIASYARFPDYHDRMGEALRGLLADIQALSPCAGRACVDAHPLLERSFARRSGVGWAGRSSMLISTRHGPWLMLGEVILDLELPADPPQADRCGTCTRCAASCPTGAITAPGVVDATRCIAYLTIEHKGPIPEPLREKIGTWLFGCDACLAACPWDRFAAPSAGAGPGSLDATEMLGLSDAEFKSRFAGTPLLRTGRARLARNAAVVLGNQGDPAAVPALTRALADPDPLVVEHAAWALGRLSRAPVAAPC